MSGFDPDWLAGREPLDAAARSEAVFRAARRWRKDRGPIAVVDLGAGTGANLRYLAPRLGGRQRWTLIDIDPRLADLAPGYIGEWARRLGARIAVAGDEITIREGDMHLAIVVRCADLAAAPASAWLGAADLITANALLDLVSATWLDRLIAAADRPGRGVLFTLNYDGAMLFSPAETTDGDVLDAFNRHQQGDKGFGPALGPANAQYLCEALTRANFKTTVGESPWRFGAGERDIAGRLIEGIAAAATEADRAAATAIAGWLEKRRGALADGTLRIEVGHRDIFALRPR